jgi:hypothetical protein
MSEVATLSPPPAAVPSGGGLVAAIAAVMNEVHVVAKRGENEFHRYRYATDAPPAAQRTAATRPIERNLNIVSSLSDRWIRDACSKRSAD